MAKIKKATKGKIEDTAQAASVESLYTWPVGIEDAAQYCGMSVAALKYHIYPGKDGAGPQDLKGRMIGHSITFEKADLDLFLSVKRSPGWPTRTAEAAGLAQAPAPA